MISAFTKRWQRSKRLRSAGHKMRSYAHRLVTQRCSNAHRWPQALIKSVSENWRPLTRFAEGCSSHVTLIAAFVADNPTYIKRRKTRQTVTWSGRLRQTRSNIAYLTCIWPDLASDTAGISMLVHAYCIYVCTLDLSTKMGALSVLDHSKY